MYNLNTPLRATQAILAIITLGLNGYVTKWYLAHTLTSIAPNSTMFLLGVGAFTLLVLPYLFFNPALSHTHGTRPASRYFNKFAVLGLDVVLTLLWLGGFIALAMFQHKLYLCGGHVCQIMAGGSAVGAIACASFLGTTILATLHVVRTRQGDETVQMSNQSQTHSAWIGKPKIEA